MKKQLFKVGFLILAFWGLGFNGYAQRSKEKQASKDFDKYAYIDAIKIYERIAEKGYTNTSVLTNLADSYYFNGKLEEANRWYAELFEGEYGGKDKGSIGSEYYYRYAQTLKTVGNYKKSDEIMEEFARLESNDSRARLFEQNKDYLNDIETNSDRYNIKPISVNTEYSDYGASILENKLIFTSARPSGSKIHEWTNESFTGLFSTQIYPDGSFGEAELFSEDLKAKGVNEATAVFTRDGNTMYFTRNNSSEKGKRRYNDKDTALLKIYKSIRQENGRWSKAEELPINSNNFNTAHPALSPDENWLYFASDREGTLGESDIFRVGLYATNTYGKVENVGNKINTSGRETFPFISSDGYLYFASDGRPGLGGLDIYRVKLNVDGSFGQVVNPGEPINSPQDDFGFYLDSSTRKGFVSSNRPGGTGGDDIYFFTEKVCKQQLEGIVFDTETNEIIANAELTMYDASYKVLETLTTDAKGYYLTSEVDCGGKYRLKAEAPEYNTAELTVSLDRQPGVKKQDIGLEPTQKPIAVNDDLFKKLKLEPIYFDFDKSNIRPDAAIELMKIVEVMKEYPTMKIDVRSHTDSRGNDDYNMKLSDRRAQSTIQWIIGQGIDVGRITGKGYGESQLLNRCSNDVPCSKEEHQLNRRSEFIIVEM